MPATTIPARISRMTPGTVPAGTNLPGFGRVLRSSLTAYEVTTPDGTSWLPFTHVHPLVPASPLVVLG